MGLTTIAAPIPAVTTSGTQYASDVNAFLEEVKTVLEADVPFSALSGSELDMDNTPIVGVEYLQLEEQGTTPDTSLIGGLVYYDGEFYAISADGAIQWTDNGQINAAAVGGIGGDYGGVNPASFRFVDSTSTYEAYDDFTTGTWAFERNRGVDIAAGATSSVFVKIRYSGSLSYTLSLPPLLPSSGRQVVLVDDTGALLKNDATNTIDNDIVLSGNARVKEVGRSITYVPNVNRDTLVSGGWIPAAGPWLQGVTMGTAGSFFMLLDGIEAGWTLKSISARFSKGTTGVNQIALYRVTDNVGTLIATANTPGVAGLQTASNTLTHLTVSGRAYIVEFNVVANNDQVLNFTLGFDS